MIRIISGLKEGQVVLLTPPLAPAEVEQAGDKVTVERATRKENRAGKTRPSEKDKNRKPKMEFNPEQMRKMREKFEKMSDEEKEEMHQKWIKKGQQQSGGGE
jgi:hypothetical protein